MVARTDIRPTETVKIMDPIWDSLQEEARDRRPAGSVACGFSLFDHHQPAFAGRQRHLPDLRAARSSRSAGQSAAPDLRRNAATTGRNGARILRVDIQAVYDRDPACTRFLEAILYFKGFHAIQTHRLAHWLLNRGRRDFALYLQSRSSSVFQTDINPAARIGKGIFLDHATGLVVGETAVIGDNVSILHGVTLGGTGKEGSDRHPKIGNGVLIGAGAKILGNIHIGNCSRVAAGSVVLKEVPAQDHGRRRSGACRGRGRLLRTVALDGPVAGFLRDLICQADRAGSAVEPGVYTA